MRSLLIALSFILTLVVSSNAQAVVDSTQSAATTRSTTYPEHEDHSNWGLLGLVGLIGLAGLAKRGPVERKVEYRDSNVR